MQPKTRFHYQSYHINTDCMYWFQSTYTCSRFQRFSPSYPRSKTVLFFPLKTSTTFLTYLLKTFFTLRNTFMVFVRFIRHSCTSNISGTLFLVFIPALYFLFWHPNRLFYSHKTHFLHNPAWISQMVYTVFIHHNFLLIDAATVFFIYIF